MLTEAQTEELRERLMADRQRILRNAQQAMGMSMDRDRDRIGRDSMDESVEEWMYGTALRLHDREKFLLAKIEDALGRIEAGTVDLCEDCDEPIGYPRLAARPVTTLCINCKEEREQNENDG